MDTSTSSLTDAFAAEVSKKLENTPYALTRTPTGFTVAINLADAKWWMPLSRNGLKDTFEYQVTIDEATKHYSVNDVRRRLAWRAGVNAQTLEPYFDLDYQYQSGTVVGYRRELVIGGSDRGKIEPVVDIAFSPGEKKKLIKDTATQLGLKRMLSRDQKIGAGFAIGAGVLVVILLICALVFGVLLK